jgi:arsenite-transporting ATPase
MQKFVLYGGKGGVGKTTCAAATGVKLAAAGDRTLVVSTDPAHSLGDALGASLHGEPTQVDEHLWAVEADPDRGQAAYQRIVTALASEFRDAGISLTDEDVEELFAAGFIPGSDEVASLEFFLEYGDDDQWDRIVFDTAPTGHTLRLLTLPDVLRESLSTAAKVRGEVRQLVDTARSMVFGPAAFLGKGETEDEITSFRERMEQVAARMRDPEQTEFRVVLLPETLAIEETSRLVDQLASYDVPVDTLVVNRVLEADPGECPRCVERHESHERQLDRIREEFSDVEIQVLPDLGPEAYGQEQLERVADGLAV